MECDVSSRQLGSRMQPTSGRAIRCSQEPALASPGAVIIRVPARRRKLVAQSTYSGSTRHTLRKCRGPMGRHQDGTSVRKHFPVLCHEINHSVSAKLSVAEHLIEPPKQAST